MLLDIEEPLCSIFVRLDHQVEVLRNIKKSWEGLHGKEVKFQCVQFASYEEIIKLAGRPKVPTPGTNARYQVLAFLNKHWPIEILGKRTDRVEFYCRGGLWRY